MVEAEAKFIVRTVLGELSSAPLSPGVIAVGGRLLEDLADCNPSQGETVCEEVFKEMLAAIIIAKRKGPASTKLTGPSRSIGLSTQIGTSAHPVNG